MSKRQGIFDMTCPLLLNIILYYRIILLLCFFFIVSAYSQTGDSLNTEDSLDRVDEGTGPVKVIITRPVTKFGNAELKDKWLLLLCENHLDFRLKGIESISVVSPDVLSALLKDYVEYEKPVTLDKYIDVAKKLSVPYVVYVQCEYYKFASETQVNLGDDINFFGKLVSIDRDTSLIVEAAQFPLRKLGFKLDKFMLNVIEKMEVEITDKNRQFLETAIISDDDKKVKKLGELLAAFNGPENIGWDKFYPKYKKILKREPDMLIGYYAGAKVCEAEKKYEEGASLSKHLLDLLEIIYPPTYVKASRLYRLSGDYDEALRILNSAPKSRLIDDDVEKERGLLYEKMGGMKESDGD